MVCIFLLCWCKLSFVLSTTLHLTRHSPLPNSDTFLHASQIPLTHSIPANKFFPLSFSFYSLALPPPLPQMRMTFLIFLWLISAPKLIGIIFFNFLIRLGWGIWWCRYELPISITTNWSMSSLWGASTTSGGNGKCFRICPKFPFSM